MRGQHDFDSRIQTFLKEYPSLCRKDLKEKDELFKQITALIVDKKGIVKISELEKLSGYTSRYINKLFEDELGLSAKQLCKTVRFQFMLGEINSHKIESLTALATEYAFYDQAHFIHEFKENAGLTPGQYAKEIESKKYGESIRTL